MEHDRKFSHKETAVSCFNFVWDLMEKKFRRPEETLQMLHLAHASIYHWTQCEDYTPTNLSIGYWQLSRAYAVAEEFGNALKYAEICIDISKDASVGPFYRAYAREAAARACAGLHDYQKGTFHLESAVAYMGEISQSDLEVIRPDLEELEKLL